MSIVGDARNKAKHWAAFDKPVLARTIDRQADEIERLRAALNSIVGMALGSVGIGKIHQTAVNALNDEQSVKTEK